MKTKRLLGIFALVLTTVLSMSFMTHKTFVKGNDQISFIQQESGDWAGEVWVEQKTEGQPGRTVTYWHLMATNTTGQGHCIEGYIEHNGNKIPVCAYVSPSANSRKNAESIYYLRHSFSVVKNSFKSVDAINCL